jgi:hypothetical protein
MKISTATTDAIRLASCPARAPVFVPTREELEAFREAVESDQFANAGSLRKLAPLGTADRKALLDELFDEQGERGDEHRTRMCGADFGI